jgi:ATP-binding cassette subfamily E protein 1
MAVREGINIFLSGFVPSENMRFRDYELTFKVPIHRQTKINETQEGVEDKKLVNYSYPSMIK